jgi:hypothetical protein
MQAISQKDIATMLYFESKDAVILEIVKAEGQELPSIYKQIQTAIMAQLMKLFVNLQYVPDRKTFSTITNDVLNTWKQLEKDGNHPLFIEIWQNNKL